MRSRALCVTHMGLVASRKRTVSVRTSAESFCTDSSSQRTSPPEEAIVTAKAQLPCARPRGRPRDAALRRRGRFTVVLRRCTQICMSARGGDAMQTNHNKCQLP